MNPDYLLLNAGPGVEAFSTCYPDLIPTLPGVTLAMPRQTHTANVAVVEDGPIGIFPETDALITRRTDIAVGIRTADCVPIVLNAGDIHAIAAVHAGWKGTIARIAEVTVNRLIAMGADPAKIYAAMGPCICGKCYEVSRELAETFAKAGFAESIQDLDDAHAILNLPDVNRRILEQSGLKPENIALPTACTKETPIYPSWRRSPGTSDRLITLLRIVNSD